MSGVHPPAHQVRRTPLDRDRTRGRGPWRRRNASGRVRRMFAHFNQNWWWTAHPAAH
ncbi:trp operon leader peptide [Streptomyces neyagawaensis]